MFFVDSHDMPLTSLPPARTPAMVRKWRVTTTMAQWTVTVAMTMTFLWTTPPLTG